MRFFLSCLRGSERELRYRRFTGEFLSCLRGSERAPNPAHLSPSYACLSVNVQPQRICSPLRP
jgi:hypothetical protein